MANELDEMTGPVNEAGRDVNVIEKQILVKVGWGSTFFQVILWVLGMDRAVDLDKDVFVKVAEARGGKTGAAQDVARNEVNAQLDSITRSINVAFEAYPDLKAHNEIEDCLQQNSYLQREITAAREAYNDAVLEWNSIIFQWPTYKIVAAKNGYTTRIPFTASKETKDAARSVLF